MRSLMKHVLLFGNQDGGAPAWTPTWLFRANFPTDASAPLTSPLAVDVGELTIVDTNDYASVTGGKLLNSNHTGAFTDPRFYDATARTRKAGLAAMFKSKNQVSQIGGWFVDTLGATAKSVLSVYQAAANSMRPYPGMDTGDSATNTTEYAYACVLRDVGGYIFVKGGSEYTEWTLLWVDRAATTTPLYSLWSGNGGGSVWRDDLGVCELPSPFDEDEGIATQIATSPDAGAEIAHEADGWIYAAWTAVTGQTWELDVRRANDDNRWIVRCSQGDGTIKLIERNAGTETERSSASQTWTNGTTYRVTVRAVGNRIMTRVGFIDKNRYAAASFNNTATIAKTSHALAVFASYPRTLSGEAAQVLDRANFT